MGCHCEAGFQPKQSLTRGGLLPATHALRARGRNDIPLSQLRPTIFNLNFVLTCADRP